MRRHGLYFVQSVHTEPLAEKSILMALWEGITERLGESLFPNLLIGAAVIVLAPVVVRTVRVSMRPVATTLAKGGTAVATDCQLMSYSRSLRNRVL